LKYTVKTTEKDKTKARNTTTKIMFSTRPLVRAQLVSPATKSLFQFRNFHQSTFQLAKKGKKHQTEEPASNEPKGDMLNPKDFRTRVSTDLTKLLEVQKKKLSEASKGKNDIKIFDNLKIGKDVFTNVASTTQKGKNLFIVTVFDPKNTKHVVSAILGANLNLNPEKMPDNEQQLKITLPPVTQESRNKLLKDLKKINDEFKAGPFANVRNK